MILKANWPLFQGSRGIGGSALELLLERCEFARLVRWWLKISILSQFGGEGSGLMLRQSCDDLIKNC